ncbi:hypothetical protein PR202_gb19871 [Eleusine coracana subsp. coracana]|uniref:Uncharacterized protein n=1 Tax=Eleusine coracana subsp. coracana TaxID=191504 RepID=A0AAV5FB00_ELECO|nr:hypothetical protein PR202_gb19871 [Eleusine coracana subsp. coracana]
MAALILSSTRLHAAASTTASASARPAPHLLSFPTARRSRGAPLLASSASPSPVPAVAEQPFRNLPASENDGPGHGRHGLHRPVRGPRAPPPGPPRAGRGPPPQRHPRSQLPRRRGLRPGTRARRLLRRHRPVRPPRRPLPARPRPRRRLLPGQPWRRRA